RSGVAAAQAEKERLRKEELATVMQAGKNLTREGRWKEAQAKFKEIEEVDPNFPELRQYLDKAPREIEVEGKLEEAQKALGGGRLADASELLRKANSATALYNPRLRSLLRALDGRLAPRLTEAKAAMAAGNFEKAQELLGDLLKVSPDNRDAQTLLEQVDRDL